MPLATERRKHYPYVALMGAYERDNFGDILFLKVSEKLLAPWPVVPLSLLSRDMRQEGAGSVVSASAWFDSCEIDLLPSALIAVGGEILNCSSHLALQYDISRASYAAFRRVEQPEQARVVRAIAWRASDLAYVPDSIGMPEQNEPRVPVAINSAGGCSAQPGSPLFESARRALELAKYASVRDSVSHTLFNSSGTVELCPDVVSALSTCCTEEVETAYRRAVPTARWLTKPYLLVQMNDHYATSNGVTLIGQSIAQAAEELGLAVVLQPAGLAAGHDSLEMLDEIGAAIRRSASQGSLQVFSQRNRDVWMQVAVIAHAACFVGTSLHGRIVAATFARPRVGLKNAKVTNYALTWEQKTTQPHDVLIEDLLSAVKRAMAESPDELRSHAKKQNQLATAGFDRMCQSLGLNDYLGDAAATAEKIRSCTQYALLRECELLRASVIDLGCERWFKNHLAAIQVTGTRRLIAQWVKRAIRRAIEFSPRDIGRIMKSRA